jgi:cobalt-zinc-cadmium resistance protein CzcA
MQRANLQTLLNSGEPVAIAADSLTKRDLPVFTDSLALAGNPSLAYLRQQIEIAREAKSLEKAQLLPDIRVGYFNQSLIGFQEEGGTSRYYGPNDRFTGVEAGVSVPLWIGPRLAGVRAAEVRRQIAASELAYSRKNLQGQYTQAVQQYLKYQNSLEYYRQNALPQAALILQNAQQGFQGGAIGYLEYVQALERALAIQSDYLELLNQYNQSVITLEFVTGKQ